MCVHMYCNADKLIKYLTFISNLDIERYILTSKVLILFITNYLHGFTKIHS